MGKVQSNTIQMRFRTASLNTLAAWNAGFNYSQENNKEL